MGGQGLMGSVAGAAGSVPQPNYGQQPIGGNATGPSPFDSLTPEQRAQFSALGDSFPTQNSGNQTPFSNAWAGLQADAASRGLGVAQNPNQPAGFADDIDYSTGKAWQSTNKPEFDYGSMVGQPLSNFGNAGGGTGFDQNFTNNLKNYHPISGVLMRDWVPRYE